MPAGRFDDRDTRFVQPLCQIGSLAQAVSQVGFVQAFPQANRHGVQVAAGQAAVGGEAFAQDQFVLDMLEERFVVHRQEAADIDDGVLFGAHGHAIRQGEDFAGDLEDGHVLVARLAQLDEVGVLGEAAESMKKGMSYSR